MSFKALSRRDPGPGAGLRKALAAQAEPASPSPIPSPPESAEEVQNGFDSLVLDSFTAEDAWELGHLLYARLLPFAAQKPTLVSISLANSGQVLFQTAVGSGTAPDNEVWVQRKRSTVLRFGTSTWFMHCKFAGDEEAFRLKYGMSPDKAGEYAIHGGGVPIRVKGVEGVVAVVVVSGLKQHEDHGVIFDVVRENWQ
ncbi:hypothetical protein MGN70_002663 [Eutypa lata]|uniref:Putative duf967 domain-containing protein n=1 Tax=Eutypa lata (strain UCR-EL1) TaxID=1287681 RepID=M7SBX6_EUTLA|nr:putative duf967 domain-containing protein [Eutypa lata UCREL1]KAI1255921.1 hypothetical protein MGN70_002663 [Eutypa lata]